MLLIGSAADLTGYHRHQPYLPHYPTHPKHSSMTPAPNKPPAHKVHENSSEDEIPGTAEENRQQAPPVSRYPSERAENSDLEMAEAVELITPKANGKRKQRVMASGEDNGKGPAKAKKPKGKGKQQTTMSDEDNEDGKPAKEKRSKEKGKQLATIPGRNKNGAGKVVAVAFIANPKVRFIARVLCATT